MLSQKFADCKSEKIDAGLSQNELHRWNYINFLKTWEQIWYYLYKLKNVKICAI